MHADEVQIDATLVRRLIAEQFPQWADLPISAVRSTATVNAIYRLGDHLYARLPRVEEWAEDLEKEWRWLPKLAPRLSMRIPEPIAMGHPASSYPFSWAIYGWIAGQPYSDQRVNDERQAARDLAEFVGELRRIGLSTEPASVAAKPPRPDLTQGLPTTIFTASPPFGILVRSTGVRISADV